MRRLTSLSIPVYADGYNADVSNCWDYTIAGAAGNFNRDNYFYYCALYGALVNYSPADYDRSLILERLGLRLRSEPVGGRDDFIESVIRHIDRNEPVLFPAYYNLCIFFDTYREEAGDVQHMLLIDGYCREKEVFQLREYLSNIEALANVTKAHIFSKYWYSFAMLSDIFQQSRERDRSRDAKASSEILYLTPAEQKAAFSYGNLAEFVLDLLSSQHNTFCEAMLHFCQQPHDLEEANVQILRRNYSLSLKPLFDGLEWGLADYLNGETRQTFDRIKQGQMDTRYIVLSLCHKSQLVQRPLDRPAINSYIETMRRLDRELYDFLLAWSKRRRRQDSNRRRIPFRVSASSESEINPARRIAEEGGGYWESRMDGNVHWVEIQPEAEVPVSQMVVRHHPFLFYITKEFEIQGSHDGRTWTALDRRENNMDAVTTHELREGLYPRYRIYITTPGEIDYSARLEGVELLARKERT